MFKRLRDLYSMWHTLLDTASAQVLHNVRWTVCRFHQALSGVQLCEREKEVSMVGGRNEA